MNRNGLLALIAAALLLSIASPAVAKPTRDIKLPSVAARLDGGTVRVTARVKVAGKVKPFAIAYRIDKIALGQKKLARGKRSQAVVFSLPPGLAPGPHSVVACADARKKIRERNERNNCRAAKVVIPGAPVPSPPGPP